MKANLSLCLIVKDAEASLSICLNSVAGVADEVIVVDTGSTDRTKAVAAEHGALVFDFPWQDDFAAARNASLKYANGEWVLWLDADEYLDDQNRGRLQDLTARLDHRDTAFVMTQRSATIPGGQAVCLQQVRLFRKKPEVRWEYRVHEQLFPALRRAGYEIWPTDIVIEHSGYQDQAIRSRKLERNLRLLHLDVAEHPNDPFPLFNLGRVYCDLGRFSEAIPVLCGSLEFCQEGNSIAPKVYVALVTVHLQLGHWRQADTICRLGLERFPGNLELLFFQGIGCRRRRDVAGAENSWCQLLRNAEAQSETSPSGIVCQPNSATVPFHFRDLDEGLVIAARSQLALLHQEQGRVAEAEALWREVLLTHPTLTEAAVHLGQLYLAQRQWAKLEQIVTHLEQRLPDDPQAALLRARASMAVGDFATTRQVLEAAIARVPDCIDARIMLAEALLHNSCEPAAVENALRAVLQRAPNRAASWHNLVVLLRQQGRWAEAIATCRSACTHCPEDFHLLLMHGTLLRERGQFAESAAILRYLVQELATMPANGASALALQARHNLALIANAEGRAGEAETLWRDLLAEHPDWTAGWLGLADALLAQGRLSEVEEIAARLESGPQAQTEAVLLRARRNLVLKNFSVARQMLEKIIECDPQNMGARLLLSQVLLQEGKDWDAAEQSLREVLAIDSGHAEARHNLSVLQSQRNSMQECCPGPERQGSDVEEV